MMSWFKRLAAPVAAVAMMGLGAVAKADTVAVSFHTTGAFVNDSPSGAIASGSSLSVGNTTLTYNVQDLEIMQSDLVNGVVVDSSMFGSFSISSTDPNGVLTEEVARSFVGAQFTLTVIQDTPVAADNTGQFKSLKITGELQYQEPDTGKTESSLVLTFADPLSFTIEPGATYTIDPVIKIGKVGGALPSQEFGVGGTVAVPLPGIAWAGMALLGSLGGARGLKRLRRQAVAA